MFVARWNLETFISHNWTYICWVFFSVFVLKEFFLETFNLKINAAYEL